MSKRSRRPARAAGRPKPGPASASANAEGAATLEATTPHPQQQSSILPGFTGGVLAEVATRLWRARRHAIRTAESTASEQSAPLARSVLREVDAALATLDRAGVTVQDHDGAAFDPGLTLVAVSFQPVDGLAHEQVLETLRPSIYLGGRHVQRGEVVVGVPRIRAPEPAPLQPNPPEPEAAEPAASDLQLPEESPDVR